MSTADFRVMLPTVVTDAILTSSSVIEAIQPIYVAGTTYAADVVVGVTTGTSQILYKSLQASNVGHTPASSPTWWQNLGTIYAPYAAGTTYAKGDRVSSITTDSHLLYESTVAGNVGMALTDTTKWIALGNTNRWKMFDKAVNSQTTAPDAVSVVLTAPGVTNTLVLLNLAGTSVSVSQAASGYSQTKSLMSHPVMNWYDWWYDTLRQSTDAIFDDIPPYAAAPLTVTVNNAGSTAGIGGFFLGKPNILGTTQWDLSGGVISFSTPTTDTFGNVRMVKRSNARRMTYPVNIPRGYESEAHRLLSSYTDTELIFIGSSEYTMTLTYGFLGQWDVPISNTGKMANIEAKGLI